MTNLNVEKPDVPAFIIDLSGDLTRVPQALGAAVDGILAGQGQRLVFDLGRNAVDHRLLGILTRWRRRNETLLRTRTTVHVLVVPSLWHALQWRLVMLFERPFVWATVARSRAKAAKWLEEVERRGGGRVAAR